MNHREPSTQTILINANLGPFAPVAKHLYAIGIEGKKISFCQSMQRFRKTYLPNQAKILDLKASLLTPGLMDCHTHLIFAGNRANEFRQRLAGESYATIIAGGGGIQATVEATRRASEEELFVTAKNRIQPLLSEGVTTIEIKSGYGLDLANEAKMLRVARALGRELPVLVRTTCLAAHLPPTDMAADAYIDSICKEILPSLAADGLVDAVDAFCEHLAFSPEQVERVFKTARSLDLPVKLHAEQLSNQHGCQLAAKFNALSVDHLEYADQEDITAIAKSGTVAVLLPAAYYFLRQRRKPPVAILRKHAVPIAVGSDLNPGSAPLHSLLMAMNMSCVIFGLSPEEALLGVTKQAARALGLTATHGSLTTGKQADLLVWPTTECADLCYLVAGIKPSQIYYQGRRVHG